MACVHRLFLSVLILLMVLHPGTANYLPQKSQEIADCLADSLAAWQKDGLEPLDKPEAYVKADGLWKSPVIKHTHIATVLPKTGEKQNWKADESPQAYPKHSEMAGETTKQVRNGHEHIESIFCRGAGCVIGIVIVLVAVLVGILMCFLAICWWCGRKRRFSGDQQERTGLITGSDSQDSSPELAI